MADHKLRANQATFLEKYAKTKNVRKAAQMANVGRSTVYNEWLPQPHFKAAFDEVEAGFIDDAEECLRKSAALDWKAAIATIEKYKQPSTAPTKKRGITYANDD